MAGTVFPERSSGVLLHPISLPGPYGIGDIGPAAHEWAARLGEARQTWWQMLPLGPTGYGDSPYQSPSSFAGNPNLLSPDLLFQDGLLDRHELARCQLPDGPIDYAAIIRNKRQMLENAWARFQRNSGPHDEFGRFCIGEAEWLDDFSLFMAIKRRNDEKAWTEWPAELSRREPQALAQARRQWHDDIEVERFAQYLFFRQWRQLREAAATRKVRLIGDLPIFVAGDSADVWAHPELFQLDAQRQPIVVAGVPPDYFSKTGQFWGNPIYDWDRMSQDGYAWWTRRLRATLRLVDIVRLDHFRGLDAYWAIPAKDATAEHGRWASGPGRRLLAALHAAFAGLPIIAEDLGFITPEVEGLRTEFNLPGMRILQFAFGGAVEERFLPHRFDSNTVVYTGTHDNDTTRGWFDKLTADERRRFNRYAPDAQSSASRALIRLAWASVAQCAIVPLQDVLGLGSESRLNTPGTTSGNWLWRASAAQVGAGCLEMLHEFSDIYQRNET